MGNHFHLLVRMFPGHKYTDEDIIKRYVEFYGDDGAFADGRLKHSALTAARRGNENEPRDVAVYLIRTMRSEPLMKIGAGFG